MGKARRKFEPEFKSEAVRLVREQAAAFHQINLRNAGDMRIAARLPASEQAQSP
jgi:hypothetical protein